MTCKKEFVRIMYTVICMNMQKIDHFIHKYTENISAKNSAKY